MTEEDTWSASNPAPMPVDPTFAMFKPTVTAKDGSTRHPHGLYWLLRYSKHVDKFIVESVQGTRECILTAVLDDTSKDVDYTIRFAVEDVCFSWLKSKNFKGKQIVYNGKQRTI